MSAVTSRLSVVYESIDRRDQLMGYYNVGRRSKKWWKRNFAYLLEVSILNAYILKKSSNMDGKEISGWSTSDF